MNRKPLVLVGGGGHCRSVLDVVESLGCKVEGILDAHPQQCSVWGYPILGDDSLIPALARDCEFIITIGHVGNPQPRLQVAQLLAQAEAQLATIIAPTATVSRHAQIQPGTVVMHKAYVGPGACIDTNCIINTLACVEHDVAIAANVHVATTATVNGACRIGENALIGSGSVVKQGVHICADAVVGAGAVVVKPITEPGIYVSANPCRKL